MHLSSAGRDDKREAVLNRSHIEPPCYNNSELANNYESRSLSIKQSSARDNRGVETNGGECCSRQPLCPYLRGFLVELLRMKLKPKDLNLFPSDGYPPPLVDMSQSIDPHGNPFEDFMEYSIVRNWMESWLKYLKCAIRLCLRMCPLPCRSFLTRLSAPAFSSSEVSLFDSYFVIHAAPSY